MRAHVRAPVGGAVELSRNMADIYDLTWLTIKEFSAGASL